MAKTAKQLREERADLIAQNRALLEERGDNFTAEDDATYNARMADADKLKVQYERIERQEREESSLANVVENPHERQPGGQRRETEAATLKVRGLTYGQTVEVPAGVRAKQDYRDAFAKALSGQRLSGEMLAALQSDDDPSGGYLVASEQFATGLIQAVDDILYVRQHATVHVVREATSLGIRKRTSRASTFRWGAELEAPTADTSLKFGKKILTPHYLSGELLVSNDLLRRNLMGVEQIVMSELARDSAEVEEQAFLLGVGGDLQPLGVFVASNDGISTARDISSGNETTSITGDGLRSVKYSLKAQHRGSARWLFHRDAVSQISKLKNTVDGGYIWREGIALGDPDTILGLPVDESEKVPNTFTTGQYVGLLANWRYYEIADALEQEIQRLMELNARTNQVGYLVRRKLDGMPTLEEAFARVTLA